MARTYLLDTGVLVALADARDPDHDACREAWGDLRGEFVTVEGVLVEAAHMVRRHPKGAETILGLVRAVDAEVVSPSGDRYDRVLDLMRKYADVPMDFVDGLLVAVAEERRLDTILSLDHRGFATYRIAGRRRFTILP